MKKLLSFFFLVLASPAYAGVTCTLPFNLQNNTVADATQVMANYNALVTCLASAAHDGANSDITSLSALVTPLTPAQGGASVYFGGTSTGPGEAQAVASVTPTGFTLSAGKRVSFIAGATNDCCQAMTLSIGGTTAKTVYRRTTVGAVPANGGEIIAGNYIEVVYDGTNYQILNQGVDNVGAVVDWAGPASATVPPPGYVFADGKCWLQTELPTLFAIIGTTYGGGCAGNEFPVADLRGRLAIAADNQGGEGAANRLSFNCAATTADIGTGCGDKSVMLTTNQMPVHSHGITDPGHSHNYGSGNAGGPSGGGTLITAGTSNATSSNTTGITTQDAGGTDFTPLLNPMMVVYKIIKF